MKKGTYLRGRSFLEELQHYPNKSLKLSQRLFHVLNMFSKYPYMHTYEVYNHLNKHKKIAYKNVHKMIHRLATLKLITKVKGTKLKAIKKSRKYLHKPIFYELTMGGIFSLFSTRSLNIDGAIFENFSKNLLFKVFLEPVLIQNSIKEVKRCFFLKNELIRYLASCCKIASSYEFALTRLSTEMTLYNPELDDSVLEDDDKLLLFLGDVLRYDTTHATIFRGDNNLVNVYCEGTLISIGPGNMSKYSITINNIINMEMKRIAPDSELLVVDREQRIKRIIEMMFGEVYHATIAFVFSLLISVTDRTRAWRAQAKSEAAILSHDQKFSRFLKTTIGLQRKAYEEFESL